MTYPILEHETWSVTDPSKLTTLMDCSRWYFYEYVLGWRTSAPNNHLHFGTSWHVAMEHILLNGYGDMSVANAFDKFLAKYREEFPEESDELYAPKTPTNALKALVNYAQKYKRDLDENEVLKTEISGTVLVTPEDAMFFRMDSILRDQNGMHFSLEHKTGSRLTRQWRDQWALSMQVGTYTHVLYCLHEMEKVKGVKINGAFFYKSKPAEFERIPAWKSREQMQVWLWNTVHWLDLLKWYFQMLEQSSDNDPVLMAFPMNTNACTKYFGCPYHDFCESWPNPLQRCDEPPMGYKIEYWDPREGESKKDIGTLSADRT